MLYTMHNQFLLFRDTILPFLPVATTTTGSRTTGSSTRLLRALQVSVGSTGYTGAEVEDAIPVR